MSAYRSRAKIAGNAWTGSIATSACVLLASQGSTVRPTSMNARRRPVFMAGTELWDTHGGWKTRIIIITYSGKTLEPPSLRAGCLPHWFGPFQLWRWPLFILLPVWIWMDGQQMWNKHRREWSLIKKASGSAWMTRDIPNLCVGLVRTNSFDFPAWYVSSTSVIM